MAEKSCRNCVHQLMCEPFRKIEEVLLGEDSFNKEWANMDQVYESIADMCGEHLGVETL